MPVTMSSSDRHRHAAPVDTPPPEAPLAGIRVLEVALGPSRVAAGAAVSLPGSILRDLGAEVHRVATPPTSLDRGLELDLVWDHGKAVEELAPDAAAARVRALVGGTDVVLVAGPTALVEDQGLGTRAIMAANPRAVVVRVRPSWDASGTLPDVELLVAAHLGLTGQIRGHRPGPTMPAIAVGQVGAGLTGAVGALAGLYERLGSGRGRWFETSLADGLAAVVPMIVGRAEHPSASTDLLWHRQGPEEALSYRCADGQWVQLWFGAKGAYEAFLTAMGDEPSIDGYRADLASGALVDRGRRWAARFATRPRDRWLADLAGADFRCEPVLAPGEILQDAAIEAAGWVRHVGTAAVAGPLVRVTATPPSPGAGDTADRPGTTATAAAPGPGALPLAGLRILDLSAYLAGPIATAVLAELGADVVKVEPTTGDAHRPIEPMFAAAHRGKRSVALDLKARGAADVLATLVRWADVVHHNARLGLPERLGYDEETIHRINDRAVTSALTGFGTVGWRAPLAVNDQLVQALVGMEAAQGGAGAPPTYLVWGAVDVVSGWLAACGIVAGLLARRRTGHGQHATTSLVAGGLTLVPAAVRGGTVTGSPVLDADQRGFGAAYRLYETADGAWLAVAVVDAACWTRLRAVTDPALPADPPPLRRTGDGQPEERALEAAFRTHPAAWWLETLARAEVPACRADAPDRAELCRRLLDDPVRQQIGAVVHHRWGPRGLVAQPRLAPRTASSVPPPSAIPALGEHTAAVLIEAGMAPERVDALAQAGVVVLGAPTAPAPVRAASHPPGHPADAASRPPAPG